MKASAPSARDATLKMTPPSISSSVQGPWQLELVYLAMWMYHPVLCPPIHSSPSLSLGNLSVESTQAVRRRDHHLHQMTVSLDNEKKERKKEHHIRSEYPIKIFQILRLIIDKPVLKYNRIDMIVNMDTVNE
jgi:hypothetical protein